jgi:hypothetical protein
VDRAPEHGTTVFAGPPMGRIIAAMLVVSGLLVWWLAAHGLYGLMLFHAGAMLVAWAVLVPSGVLLARYFKITRQQDFPRQLDNRFWWNWHRALQYAGVTLSTAGFFAMVNLASLSLETTHARFGLAVVMIGWIQVLSGLLRGSKGGPTEPELRGDHYDMTPRRRAFEYLHKYLGWIMLPLALIAALTGMTLVAMSLVAQMAVAALFLLFAGLAVHFQRQRRHVSTYVAIWGVEEPLRNTKGETLENKAISQR